MLTNVKVPANVLKSILKDIATLIPTGTSTIPVGLTFEPNKLYFTCLGKCNYENHVNTECDISLSITIAYSAIHDLLSAGQEVTITVVPQGVMFMTDRFSRGFNNAYSTINKLQYKDKILSSVRNRSTVISLRKLTRTPLTKLYNREPAVAINNEIAILKYENVWYQMRATGFLYNITMTQECLKALSLFNPEESVQYAEDTLMFKRDTAVLFVPVNKCVSTNTITEILPKGGVSLKINIGKFSDDINLVKTLGIVRTEICLYANGITVHGETAVDSMTVRCGDCSGDVQCLFHLPAGLAHFIFSVFTDCTIELLFDEGVLCLRNTDTAIVTHVLL